MLTIPLARASTHTTTLTGSRLADMVRMGRHRIGVEAESMALAKALPADTRTARMKWKHRSISCARKCARVPRRPTASYASFDARDGKYTQQRRPILAWQPDEGKR